MHKVDMVYPLLSGHPFPYINGYKTAHWKQPNSDSLITYLSILIQDIVHSSYMLIHELDPLFPLEAKYIEDIDCL